MTFATQPTPSWVQVLPACKMFYHFYYRETPMTYVRYYSMLQQPTWLKFINGIEGRSNDTWNLSRPVFHFNDHS